LFRLAGHLKVGTVKELSARLSVAELREWWAFDRYIEPFGREWHQTALLAAMSVAPHCGKNKAPKPEDFLPIVKRPMTNEQIAAQFALLGKILHG
jgi:hypothetical protein